MSRSQAHSILLRLNVRFLFAPSVPLYSSVTFLEDTAPVKLSTRPCLLPSFYMGQGLSLKKLKERCFIGAEAPSYATQLIFQNRVKFQ